MGIAIYIIIGTALLTYTSVCQWKRDKEYVKVNLRTPLWWVITFMCALLWPVLLLSTIYDAVRMVIRWKESA